MLESANMCLLQVFGGGSFALEVLGMTRPAGCILLDEMDRLPMESPWSRGLTAPGDVCLAGR